MEKPKQLFTVGYYFQALLNISFIIMGNFSIILCGCSNFKDHLITLTSTLCFTTASSMEDV